MIKNFNYYGRVKYVDIKYYFVWDYVNKKLVSIVYCFINDMVVDLLIKGLYKG